MQYNLQHKTVINVIEFENLHDAHGILEIGTLADGKCHILGNSRNRFLSLRCSPRGIVSKLRRFPGLPFRSHDLRSAPLRIRLQNIRPNQIHCNSPPPNPPLTIHSRNNSCSYAQILPIFIPLNLPEP